MNKNLNGSTKLVKFLNVEHYEYHLSVSGFVFTYTEMDGRTERFKISSAMKRARLKIT
jgi:hypothetical protein